DRRPRTWTPQTSTRSSSNVASAKSSRSTWRSCQHNADELFPVVSAASILAKVCRDRQMRTIEDEIGMHIGSGYASDADTIAFLETWIRTHGSLPPHTRASWDTARRLLAEARNHKLADFGRRTA